MRRDFDSMMLLLRLRSTGFAETFFNREKFHRTFLGVFAGALVAAIDLAFEASISASLMLVR